MKILTCIAYEGPFTLRRDDNGSYISPFIFWADVDRCVEKATPVKVIKWTSSKNSVPIVEVTTPDKAHGVVRNVYPFDCIPSVDGCYFENYEDFKRDLSKRYYRTCNVELPNEVANWFLGFGSFEEAIEYQNSIQSMINNFTNDFGLSEELIK